MDANNSMLDFITAGQANLVAYLHNTRPHDVVAKKQHIVDELETFYNITPANILFVGFSSFIFAQYNANLYVTAVNDQTRDYLTQQDVQFTYVPVDQLHQHPQKFDVVVAVDEFFTYAASDIAQRALVDQICALTRGYVITTLRDYKNQDFKDREFSHPLVIKNTSDHMIFLEAHNWSTMDRNTWVSTVYQIDANTDHLVSHGPCDRHTMFFKQLAKFSMDAGATNFTVHKNLMYKGLIKKNYEHVITIKLNHD